MNNSETIRKNKDIFIKHYINSNDLKELENTLNNINHSGINSKEIEEIKNAIIKRINELKKNDLNDILNNAKKTNYAMNDFSIIETKEEENEKDIYGFRNDMYYLKLSENGNNIIYEIENLDMIRTILGNVGNMTKSEILEKLKPFLKELPKTKMDYKTNLEKETLKKEIDNIYDNEIKQAFLNNINQVLKERIVLNKYIVNNDLENEELNYSLNSKGERLYYIKDKIVKFDSNLKMFFLDSSGNTLAQNNNTNKENENNNENKFSYDRQNKEENNKLPEIKTLSELDNEYYINLLNYIIYKMGKKESLSLEEGQLINKFFLLCLNNKENISGNLYKIYTEFSDSLKNYNDYEEYNNYLNNDVLDGIKNKNDLELANEKEKKDSKNLTLENNSTGFVDITLIICAIIMTIVVILYIVLVKK